MSNPAITWAKKQKTGRAADKCILLLMADIANLETGECYPSQASLVEESELDRKTVIAAVARLRSTGLIVDTGKRKGTTNQVIVWRLATEVTVPLSEPLPKGTIPKTAPLPVVETVPFFPPNSPVFPKEESRFSREGSRFSRERVPKTGHGTLTEPTKEPKEEPSLNPLRAKPEPPLLELVPPAGKPCNLIEEAVEVWNLICGGVGNGRVSKITDARRSALRIRLREDFQNDLVEWRRYCLEISLNAFLTGGGDRGWRADFDWAVKPGNLVKVREGKFADVQPRAPPRSNLDFARKLMAVDLGGDDEPPPLDSSEYDIDLAPGDYHEA